MERDRVTVRVPATSANLGPGFDSLGIALDIFSSVRLERSNAFSISASGEGAELLAEAKNNIVLTAIERVFQRVGKPVPPLKVSIENTIPIRRGMGSSASAVIGGLVGANVLCGEPLSNDDLLVLGTEMEGHPDNVTPALLGGCTVAVVEKERIAHIQVPLPKDLEMVVFVPDFDMATHATRVILPAQVSREDAVYNIGRAALLVAAFATNKTDLLKIATQDRLHQPCRKQMFPQMDQIFAAAMEAGAVGVFLSGAGSSIMALAVRSSQAIADSMQKEATRLGVGGCSRITRPSLVGTYFEEG